MKEKRAPEVQNELRALKTQMAAKGASSDAIVEAFLRKHPDVVRRESKELIKIGLMTLVGHVGAKQPKGSTAQQMEMFAEFKLQPTILMRKPDGSREHRQTRSLKLREVREQIQSAVPKTSTLSKSTEEMMRMLETLEPYKVSEESTVDECWLEYLKARGGS